MTDGAGAFPVMKRIAMMLAPLAIAGATLAPAASAKVAQVGPNGFVVRHIGQVPASAEEAWAVLIKPALWWDSDHTWSGDAANLSLDARAGGCFCEILLDKAAPKAGARGSVEHMRVIYVERPRALRMVGALGPLQADAVNATLTIQLKPDEKGGTQILLEYAVGGFSRTPFEKLAPGVDGVLGEQMQHLTAKLGGAFAAAFQGIEPGSSAPAEQVEPPKSNAPGVVPLADTPPANDGEMLGR